MQCLSNKMDTCFLGNHVGMKENRKHYIFAGKFSVVLFFMVTGMTLLFSALPASGQYMVQPAKLELSGRVRTILEPELSIHNLDPNQTNEITLRVVELSQKPSGEWLMYDPDPTNTIDHISDFDVSKLSSCLSWIKLEKESVTLDPYGDEKVKLQVKIPTGMRGCYAAGILCAMRMDELGDSQVPFILRVLVPIIVKVETRPPRSNVVLKDVNMEYRNGKTFLKMNIDNEGLTYPRLLPMCRIWALSNDGHYRLIETHEFRDIGILPGVKLALESDIGRKLPSGNYKIIGGVYVDQMPSKKVEKVIDFQGDPSVSNAQAEAPLDLEPLDITISAKPGSSRSMNLEIRNASDEKVTIQGVFGIPAILASGAGNERAAGQDLICPDWLKMVPEKFELDSYAKRTVRITADMPESAIAHSNYYALLGLNAFYPDGILGNSYLPPIVLTSFRIFDQPVSFNLSALAEHTIELEYSQNFFSFEFAALDFTSPTSNEYAYMMEGFDKDWIYAGPRRYASYTNLDPGKYLLKVKGTNSDGIWNETGTFLNIFITPPFWQVWWFRVLVILAIIALLYLLHKYRLAKLLEIERLRVRIASDLHDDVGSTLTKIALHSELIQSSSDQSQAKHASKEIGTMSREIIGTMSDVVWSIDARNDTLKNLLDRMHDFVFSVLTMKEIQVEFKTDNLNLDKKIAIDFRQNIFLIFKEAINNIAKHSAATEVKVYLENRRNGFLLRIADNGRGYDPEKSKNGNGLKNIKLRSERLGGKLTINSNHGVEIILILKRI